MARKEEEEQDRRRKRRKSRSSRSSRRNRSSSSSSPSANESEEDVMEKKNKKKDRESSSSKKFTEDEIMEYLAKKAQKKAAKVAKKLKTQKVSGYSNDSNPFGDSNLNEKFVWRKKIERDVLQGMPLEDLSVKAEKKRQRERMEEIEKVKKRREERAIEKAQHEEEMAMLARERARAEFQDWEKKEEEFHFDQSKVRSEIRLREGRARPIDVLSKNLNLSDDFDIEINEPYIIFKGLTVKEMEELHDDIKMHLELDRATPTHIEYWEAIQRRENDLEDTLYKKVEKIVHHRWNKMTTPLHLFAYAISPRYYSAEVLDLPGRVPPFRDAEVADGYKKALAKIFQDLEIGAIVRSEFAAFNSGEDFLPVAIADRSRMSAIKWWYLHGQAFMYLQPLAIKVLSQALMLVCNWEIAEARKRDALDRARVRGEEPPAELLAEERGLHASIDEEVRSLLEGKDYSKLHDLQCQIESQMLSGTAKVVEYWEAVLKRLHIYKAKARLREIHADLLHHHLQRLQESDGNQQKAKEESNAELEIEYSERAIEDYGPHSPEVISVEEAAKELDEEPGSFSPELLHVYEGEEGLDPEADKAELERRRAAVLEEQQRRLQEAAVRPSVIDDIELTNQERTLAIKAMGVMEDGDAILGSGSEVNLESQVYWWHDKYRPRKPKYFNRVHTGYEWNKYNQTHYDHDNPPPKIVQGYKFNIFYPDLVDKIRAPTYTIEKDGSNGETCLIRFHAGPPYEDIAFRIVNKEWEYSHKKGFKCTFERGILHVYFNFKRYRYRR